MMNETKLEWAHYYSSGARSEHDWNNYSMPKRALKKTDNMGRHHVVVTLRRRRWAAMEAGKEGGASSSFQQVRSMAGTNPDSRCSEAEP